MNWRMVCATSPAGVQPLPELVTEGLILMNWQQSLQAPHQQRRWKDAPCTHHHPEWFVLPYLEGRKEVVGMKDVPSDEIWGDNELWNACNGATTLWDLPQGMLYTILKEHPGSEGVSLMCRLCVSTCVA